MFVQPDKLIRAPIDVRSLISDSVKGKLCGNRAGKIDRNVVPFFVGVFGEESVNPPFTAGLSHMDYVTYNNFCVVFECDSY